MTPEETADRCHLLLDWWRQEAHKKGPTILPLQLGMIYDLAQALDRWDTTAKLITDRVAL